jgi:predicted MPP superfamily phosphohydrolase
VLTGDFVTDGLLPRPRSALFSYPCAEVLSGIQCPHRFASLGNHDTLVGWEVVVDALKVHGIPTLLNNSLPVERDGARLWFAGIRSSSEDFPELHEAMPALAAPNEPVILLAHEPDYALHAAKYGVDLMLSGHTHGGQIRLPIFGTPGSMLPRGGRLFVRGYFNVGPMQLYVNRGIGTVTVPMRFRCPPEITLFTLQPAEPLAPLKTYQLQLRRKMVQRSGRLFCSPASSLYSSSLSISVSIFGKRTSAGGTFATRCTTSFADSISTGAT